MKKYLLVFTLTLLSITLTSAQEDDQEFGFTKGDVFLSGSVSYSKATQALVETKTFNFIPMGMFFVSDHFSINGGLLIGTSSNESINGNSTFDESSFGFLAGSSYYFTPENRFSFALSLAFSYEKINFDDNAGFETDVTRTAIAFSPGFNYFVSERFALQASLGAISYSDVNNDDGVFPATDRFGIDLDLSNITFGVLFKL